MGKGLYKPLNFSNKSIVVLTESIAEYGFTEKARLVTSIPFHFQRCYVVDIVYMVLRKYSPSVREHWCLTKESYEPDIQPWFLIRAHGEDDLIDHFIVNDEFEFYPFKLSSDVVSETDSISRLVLVSENKIEAWWFEFSGIDYLLVEAAVKAYMAEVWGNT